MKQISMSKTEVQKQNRQGFNNSSTCQNRISTCTAFKPGPPNILPLRNKGKSPPCRSRSPGSWLGGLNRDCIPFVSKHLIINNKEGLFQINYNQYSKSI